MGTTQATARMLAGLGWLWLAVPVPAQAGALAEIIRYSSLGLPLNIEIATLGRDADRLAECLKVEPGAASDGPWITEARISQAVGSPSRIIVTTRTPILEPVIRLGLVNQCEAQLRRTYTLLLPFDAPTTEMTRMALPGAAEQAVSMPSSAVPRTTTRLLPASDPPATRPAPAPDLPPEPSTQPRRLATPERPNRARNAEEGFQIWATLRGETLAGLADRFFPGDASLQERFVRASAAANPGVFRTREPGSLAMPAGTLLRLPNPEQFSRPDAAPRDPLPARTVDLTGTDRLELGQPDVADAAGTGALSRASLLARVDASVLDQVELLARIDALERLQSELIERASRLDAARTRVESALPPAPADDARESADITTTRGTTELAQTPVTTARPTSPAASVPDTASAPDMASAPDTASPPPDTSLIPLLLQHRDSIKTAVVILIALLILLVVWRRRREARAIDTPVRDAPPSLLGDLDNEPKPRKREPQSPSWSHESPRPDASLGALSIPFEDSFLERDLSMPAEDLAPMGRALRPPARDTRGVDPGQSFDRSSLEWSTASVVPSLNTVAPMITPEDESEESDSAVELADIMLSFGRIEGAAETLSEFIRGNPRRAVKPWLKLLDVYREGGMRAEFNALAQQLNKTFNVKTLNWDNYHAERDAQTSIESLSHVIRKLTELWGTEACQAYLEELIRDNRGGTRMGFPLVMVDELLILAGILEQQLGRYHAPADGETAASGEDKADPAVLDASADQLQLMMSEPLDFNLDGGNVGPATGKADQGAS